MTSNGHSNGHGYPGCLAGVRIVDLSQFEAGPSCTESLAWLGAEVVKVEPPGKGEQSRRAFARPSNADSWYFLQFNANKKSITIDLKSPDGIELVKKLIAQADVFIENMAPGTIERLGLGYDDVRALNPKLIYAQVKGFGEGTPYQNYLSFDPIAQAFGGIMSVSGEAGARPVKPGPGLGDTGTGMLLAISILGALYQTRGTGRGQRIQVAMEGESQGAGNGGGCHGQDMGVLPFLLQFGPLFYPKPVLFIDHHQTQFLKGHRILNQGMGAYQQG